MARIRKWQVGGCILLLLCLMGCSEAEPVKIMEINEMTNLDSIHQEMNPPLSPVMQDTYNLSIPEDVYSAD